MMRFAVACPGATVEQLERASAAARAASESSGVDPIEAAKGLNAHIHWDDSGYSPKAKPTKRDTEMMGAMYEYVGAARASLLADGLSVSELMSMVIQVRDGPDNLHKLVSDAMELWLASDRENGEFEQVVQHGGLSARARRIGTGPASYIDVKVGVGLGVCTSLARFGQLSGEEVMQPRIVEYAKKWNPSLPEAPTREQVLAMMYGDARAAWEHLRHQLNTEPHWAAHAAEELQAQVR